MKKLGMILLLVLLPTITAFGLEQTFSQHGLKATIKLTPDKPAPHEEISLTLRLEQDGTRVTNKNVQLTVYQERSQAPVISHPVDVLDEEYIDSWKFSDPGTYTIQLSLSGPGKPEDVLQYEVKASVQQPDHDHGFLSHHFGGKWGWWGAGMMALMMVPMMVLML